MFTSPLVRTAPFGATRLHVGLDGGLLPQAATREATRSEVRRDKRREQRDERRRARRGSSDSQSLPPYTEEMKERARRYIAEKDALENSELVFRRYVEVCFRAFQRRMGRRGDAQTGGAEA